MSDPITAKSFDHMVDGWQRQRIIWTLPAIGRAIGVAPDFVRDTLAKQPGSPIKEIGEPASNALELDETGPWAASDVIHRLRANNRLMRGLSGLPANRSVGDHAMHIRDKDPGGFSECLYEGPDGIGLYVAGKSSLDGLQGDGVLAIAPGCTTPFQQEGIGFFHRPDRSDETKADDGFNGLLKGSVVHPLLPPKTEAIDEAAQRAGEKKYWCGIFGIQYRRLMLIPVVARFENVGFDCRVGERLTSFGRREVSTFRRGNRPQSHSRHRTFPARPLRTVQTAVRVQDGLHHSGLPAEVDAHRLVECDAHERANRLMRAMFRSVAA